MTNETEINNVILNLIQNADTYSEFGQLSIYEGFEVIKDERNARIILKSETEEFEIRILRNN